MKMTIMAALEGAVSGSNQIMASRFWDINAGLVIQLSIIKGPVLNSQSVEEGKFLLQLVDGLKD